MIYSNFLSGSTVQDGGTTNTFPFALAANTSISGYFRVPIVGWSSNSVLSQDTDTRVVAFSAGMAGSPTISPPNGILWDTVFYDTHGAYDAATSFYHIPVSGYYKIFLSEADSTTTNNGLIYVNGSVVAQGQQHVLSGEPGLTAITYKLNAGDQVYASLSNNGTLTNGVTLNFMTIERVSGPSVIAASETVAASWGQANNQNIPNASLTYLTGWRVNNLDTHNAFNGSSGTYTVPVSGTYDLYFQGQITTDLSGQTFSYIVRTPLGGSPTNLSYGLSGAYIHQTTLPATALVKLNAGDQINFAMLQNSGGTVVMNADALGVFMKITRIGN